MNIRLLDTDARQLMQANTRRDNGKNLFSLRQAKALLLCNLLNRYQAVQPR